MKRIYLTLGLGLVLASCSVTTPLAVTNNRVGGKEGKSETVCVFGWGGISSGIVLNKNYSVSDAAKNGGITTIGSVDLKVTNYLFITKNTIIVTGE